ncbi:MAG: hypothetical protein J6C82_08600 [Clostridia bacterium]|nr:hypothetical protein [Clostridia bacterium]
MTKRIISMLLAVMMLFAIQCVSFAAYETSIPLTAQGSTTDLIYIKRPQSHSASTSDKTYTISAVGASGTNIRVYRYSESENICKLIKSAKQIGASGLYSTVVDLPDNNNTFIVYAENGGADQVVKIEISKVKKSTVDKLKNVTVNILNFLK